MNKIYKSVIPLFFYIFLLYAHPQGQERKPLVTTTYYNNKESKKISFFDDSMNLEKEEYYYVPDNSKVVIIEYDKNQKIDKFTALDKKRTFLLIDYKNGKYFDYENETILNFKGNFQFEGIQKNKYSITIVRLN